VDQAGILNTRNMARVGEHAFDVPYGFLSQRKVVGEKATPVFFGETR
jgi:hypothetical protein